MAEITKVIFTGGEGDGKSYEMAKTAWYVLHRNARLIRRGMPPRKIVSNMHFSEKFHSLAVKFGVEIVYFTTIAEMIQHVECDMFIDEISKYFSAHRWQDLPLDALTWISQGGKQGVRMYGSCQDFSQVAKAFRVLTSRVFLVKKFIGSKRPSLTLGTPLFVWGLITCRRINPKSFKGDDVTMETVGLLPQIFTIRTKFTSIFNTSEKIATQSEYALEHILKVCATCGEQKVVHR